MIKFLAVLALLSTFVHAHTVFTTLYVDGETQGDGTCIRMNRNPSEASFPIEPLSSKNVACGYDGEKGVSRVCPAKASSTLTFQFKEYADGSQPGSIDRSHKGPCAVYMKQVPDATADNNAAGDGWFKIWHSDYDSAAGKWCTEKMIDNNGFLSVQIPPDIEAGYYLVRPELLALHAAQDHPSDPQFYVGCAQVFVQSSGTAKPATVSIGEGTYDLSIPAMTYNIYATPLALPYPMYGPPVYEAGSPQSTNPKSSRDDTRNKRTQLTQTKGLKPDGCILVRDNWCGFEVPPYNDEKSCWDSTKNCWDQADVCWNTAPPTGSAHCQIWSDKCTALGESCKRKEWVGPPNTGKDLTPAPSRVSGSMKVFRRDSDIRGRRRRWRRHMSV